jgi:IS30 family transposase
LGEQLGRSKFWWRIAFANRSIAALLLLRPTAASAESHRRVGDWEGDTMGKELSWIGMLVDRRSGLLRMRRVPNGESGTVMRAVVYAPHFLQAHMPTLT